MKFGSLERGNANLRTRRKNIYTGMRRCGNAGMRERGNAKAKSRNAGTRDAKALRNARPSLIPSFDLWIKMDRDLPLLFSVGHKCGVVLKKKCCTFYIVLNTVGPQFQNGKS